MSPKLHGEYFCTIHDFPKMTTLYRVHFVFFRINLSQAFLFLEANARNEPHKQPRASNYKYARVTHPLLQPACVSIDVNRPVRRRLLLPFARATPVGIRSPDGSVSVNRAVERVILLNPCPHSNVASLIINRRIGDRWLPRN